MARQFTKKITTEELADRIQREGRDRDYTYLTPRVQQDLAKIEFDTENITSSAFEAFGKEKNPAFPAKNYVGFHTLLNGLSYLGITAGGDWEYPIYFIIYYNGKELRGYIPKEGNTWNYLNHAAFGNDEEADERGLRKRGLENMDDLDFDFEKIETDMLGRILYQPRGEEK